MTSPSNVADWRGSVVLRR